MLRKLQEAELEILFLEIPIAVLIDCTSLECHHILFELMNILYSEVYQLHFLHVLQSFMMKTSRLCQHIVEDLERASCIHFVIIKCVKQFKSTDSSNDILIHETNILSKFTHINLPCPFGVLGVAEVL